MNVLPTVVFNKGAVELIDQTRLPIEYRILRVKTIADLCEAIQSLRIRGAPALGVAGAYGLLLAFEEKWGKSDSYYFDEGSANLDTLPADATVENIRGALAEAAERLRGTRPTAVNLGWAIDRMKRVLSGSWSDPADLLRALHREARAVHEEDLAMSFAIGRAGAALLKDGDSVLTHCNTGGLATSGYGTALGVVFSAVESGKRIHVYADETRPLLQGSRLNTWECIGRGIPVTVLCDGAAASLLNEGKIACAIVGADRIAANGDTANKIGTLHLAIAAAMYRVPFYVAAPSSTIDLSLRSGAAIPIEQRSADEVRKFRGLTVAPDEAQAYNPSFDVTPYDLITAFITEKGVLQPPFTE